MVIAGAALLLAIGVGLKERGHGHIGRLKTALNVSAPLPHKTKAVQPGGQDAIVLQRMQMANATIPEFLSATLLPGHGMNVLQITAYVPGKGEVKLLASPSLEDAAKLLDGHGKSVPANTSFGGEIEVPWAGRIWGTARPDDANIAALWHGHSLNLPTDGNATGNASGIASIHGLLLGRNADSIKTNVMPDGGQAQAIYNAGDFDGHWISQTQVTITVQLSGRALEMNIAARNTGKVAEPIGIGWHPRFAILSGDRKQAILKLPTALRVESRQGVPSGKLLPVEGTTYDFVGRNGARLGNRDLDDTFVHLKPGLLDNGPIAELRDPASNFGLRVTAITPTIKAMHVYAPPNAPFVSIDPQFNYDDPFGHEWAKGEDTGMEVLEPGQTVQWKIRLEIFSLSAPSPSQRL